jgi:MFS family permease
VPPLTVAELGDVRETVREALPPYRALFAKGQLRWTLVGMITGTCAASAAFMTAALLPKALTNQGYAVSVSLGITSIIYATSFFGKGFTGWLMEIIGRRWTIFYVMAGSVPGYCLMLLSHMAEDYARLLMIVGGLIVGFTVVSAFSATRVYLSEQFPTALRGRGHLFGESCGRIFAGGLVPFFMAPHTGSPTIFFGTMLLFAAIGAAVPLLFGK